MYISQYILISNCQEVNSVITSGSNFKMKIHFQQILCSLIFRSGGISWQVITLAEGKHGIV